MQEITKYIDGVYCPRCEKSRLFTYRTEDPSVFSAASDLIVYYTCDRCKTKFWTEGYLQNADTLYQLNGKRHYDLR